MADSSNHQNHEHHILSDSMAKQVFVALIVLTIITVAVAQVDLGILNFGVAMLIASIKASLVFMIFMGLKYDHKENSVIFGSSLVFMACFFVLCFSDLLTRGDVYVKGSILPESAMSQKSKFSKAWISTPELIAHGKELFTAQCVSCHGAEGAGNGVAAAALNPKPRNFTVADGWKNGFKPSQIFGTLTKGLNTMPAFSSLPAEDRWALAHYVRSFGQYAAATDTAADFAKVGVDPNQAEGAGAGPTSIPVDVAIDLLSTD
jgi:caa(3)-type oxidase subunit IV